MKRMLRLLCCLVLPLSTAACGLPETTPPEATLPAAVSVPESIGSPVPSPEAAVSPSTRQPTEEPTSEVTMVHKMLVQAGDCSFSATLEDNAAAEALWTILRAAPMVLSLEDYAGFEKVGPLGRALPAEDSRTTTQSGDIVLYNGNQLVLFYGSNTWGYTRLGKIDDTTGWAEALGSGSITVTLSAP